MTKLRAYQSEDPYPAFMTDTYKLRIVTDKQSAEIVAEVLSGFGEDTPPAVACFEDVQSDTRWFVDAYFDEQPDREALTHLLSQSGAYPAVREFDLSVLPQEDWVAKSQSELKPVRAGRFLIHGGHDRQRLKAHSSTIEIDAGQAFGTAHHGTTRGCLIALDKLLRLSRFASVLDLGTGSGVLAIAAAKVLRHRQIYGVDIDPVAVQVARENCLKNQVGQLVTVSDTRGMFLSERCWRRHYDLVIANILAGPLYDLALPVARCSMGFLVLSGLLSTQAPRIIARYVGAGFFLAGRVTLDGWTTLILFKR